MSTDRVNDNVSINKKASAIFTLENVPWIIMASLVVLLCIYVRVRLLSIPLERDEGEYAYFAQLMLHGFPPYLHAYSMKLPGVSILYALFMAVFGQSASGIHGGLLIVVGLTISMLFFLARRLFDTATGLVAAAAYAILSTSHGVMGVFAHATHFVILFALAGYLLLMKALESRRTIPLVCSGFCFGMGILMKQHGVLFAVFALLYFLWEQRKLLPDELGRLSRHSLLFIAAVAVPFGVCCLVLTLYGTFDEFWFWTFKYAREYVSNVPFALGVKIFTEQFTRISQTSLLLWGVAGIGIFLLIADKEAKRGRVFIAGFLVFSFLAICPGLYFREHYFIMLLPAIALLIGVAVVSACNILSRKGVGPYSWVIPALLFLTVSSLSVYRERAFFFSMSPDEASRLIYGANPFPESLRVAEYLKDHTSPEDRIAILGSEPQIFFYSGRLSASGHIYMYGLMENQKYAQVMQQELIKDIESNRPKFIVFVNVYTSWLVRPDSYTLIFNWAEKYLVENYELAGVVDIFDDMTIYRWDRDIAGYIPRSEAFLKIFRRKE
jgi:hypothetical protein